jgi:hypothetical protein
MGMSSAHTLPGPLGTIDPENLMKRKGAARGVISSFFLPKSALKGALILAFRLSSDANSLDKISCIESVRENSTLQGWSVSSNKLR